MNPLNVTQQIAKKYNLLPQDILSRRRFSELVKARKEISRILLTNGMSKSAIARFFGFKDHTTITKWSK